jgi:hypothetical protein
MLRSIPPANRRVSSMRAATRTGKVFVGSADRGGQEKSTFRPLVIKPDPEVQQMRKALVKRLWDTELLEDEAAEPEEAAYWRDIIERLRGSLRGVGF